MFKRSIAVMLATILCLVSILTSCNVKEDEPKANESEVIVINNSQDTDSKYDYNNSYDITDTSSHITDESIYDESSKDNNSELSNDDDSSGNVEVSKDDETSSVNSGSHGETSTETSNPSETSKVEDENSKYDDETSKYQEDESKPSYEESDASNDDENVELDEDYTMPIPWELVYTNDKEGVYENRYAKVDVTKAHLGYIEVTYNDKWADYIVI